MNNGDTQVQALAEHAATAGERGVEEWPGMPACSNPSEARRKYQQVNQARAKTKVVLPFASCASCTRAEKRGTPGVCSRSGKLVTRHAASTSASSLALDAVFAIPFLVKGDCWFRVTGCTLQSKDRMEQAAMTRPTRPSKVTQRTRPGHDPDQKQCEGELVPLRVKSVTTTILKF